jgi:hypothetical protein
LLPVALFRPLPALIAASVTSGPITNSFAVAGERDRRNNVVRQLPHLRSARLFAGDRHLSVQRWRSGNLAPHFIKLIQML